MRQIRGWMTIGALALAACEQAEPADVGRLESMIAAQQAAIQALQARVEALEKAPGEAAAAESELRWPQRLLFLQREDEEDPAPASPPERVLASTCENDVCVTTRAEIDAILADESYLKFARIVPHLEGDTIVGVKLYAIRPNTPPAQLGLRNGDLVRSIAGIGLGDVATAMSIPDKLRGLDRWTIVGERHGAPFEITVEVR